MKKWIRLGMLAAASLLLANPVYSLDADAPLYQDVILYDGTAPAVSFYQNDVWPQDAACYADLLDETQAGYYKILEAALENLDDLQIEEYDSRNYVIIDDIAEKYASTTSERDAFLSQAQEDMEIVIEAYRRDHPGNYWNGTWHGTPYSWGTLYASVGAMLEISDECLTADQRSQFEVQIDGQVQELLTVTQDMSDIGKMAYWDNWLAANNDYNMEAARQGTAYESEYPWNLTSALLPDYTPVCEGYAEAFQYLCRQADITCITVSSFDHMWNEVKIDGVWYTVDCTHNDPIIDDSGETRDYSRREYFLSEVRDDEVIQMVLPAPEISETPYFGGWRVENGTIRGGENYASAAPTLWFALYNTSGKMIALDCAESFVWSSAKDMYIAPKFDAEDLENAARIELYRLDSAFAPYLNRGSTNIE